MKTLRMRFRVELSGWVTVEREVEEDFDMALMDVPRSYEQCIVDSMADEAVERASEELDVKICNAEVLP